MELVGASLQARKSLNELGISLKSGTFQDVYRLTSRDTEGGSYPYNAGFTRYRMDRKNWLIVKDGIEIGYYYTGLWHEHGKKTGEVGMVHLSPAVRDKGLFTPLKLLGSIELVEGGAKVLRSVVGDESGKVKTVNKKLDFSETEERVGPMQHPVWRMLIQNPKERLDFFFRQFQERITRLRGRNLDFDPGAVDIDNPARVSIQNTVAQRLEEKKWNGNTPERVLFGYAYAPVLVYQEYCRLLLRVGKVAENDQSLLMNILPPQTCKIFPYPNDIAVYAWDVESPSVADGKEAQEWVQVLATAGENFLEHAS